MMAGCILFRLCQSLETPGSANTPATVLGTLRERFVAADRKKSGFLDGVKFRAVLDSLPGTQGLKVGGWVGGWAPRKKCSAFLRVTSLLL